MKTTKNGRKNQSTLTELTDQNGLIADTKTQKNETVNLSMEKTKEIDQYFNSENNLENIVGIGQY